LGKTFLFLVHEEHNSMTPRFIYSWPHSQISTEVCAYKSSSSSSLREINLLVHHANL